MQINISTRHGQLSSASQEKIGSKIKKLERFHDRVSSVDVTVDLERKDAPSIELRVSVEKSEDFVATDSKDSLMAALDTCLHKVEQQLKKHKEKVSNHRATGRRTPVDSDSLMVDET